MDNAPVNESHREFPSGEFSPSEFFHGEFFGNADYPLLYQYAPTSCVLCHLLGHDLVSERSNNINVRDTTSHSIGFTGSESVCEVCQKLTCLPNLQPVPVEKESSMQKSNHLPENRSPERSQSLFSHPLLMDRTLNPTKVPINNISHSGRAASGNTASGNVGSAGPEVAQLRTDLQTMQAQLQASAETLRSTRRQVQHLTDRLVQANAQIETYQAEALTRENRHRVELHQLVPEPATMPTTYQVPTRSHSKFLDRLTASIPFSILMVVGGMSLAAVVALAFPTLGLWGGVSEMILTLLRGLFVAIAFSSAVAVMLELTQ